MTSLKRLGLITYRDTSGGRDFFRGACAAMREAGGWHLAIPMDTPWFGHSHLGVEPIDAFIGPVHDARHVRLLRRRGIPHVLPYTPRRMAGDAALLHDSRKIGILAARHLLQKGFRHFGALGFQNLPFWKIRTDAFAECLHSEGADVTQQVLPDSSKQSSALAARWLASLPVPCGIFCPNDGTAAWLLTLCRHLHRNVPAEVAVISSGHDQLLNLAFDMTITSVVLDEAGMARRAIEALDQGNEGPHPDIAPLGIFEGASTGFVAPKDERLVRALTLIQQRSPLPLEVDELARAAGMGRRNFEKAFAREVGRTPHREVMRVRMEDARRILLETSDSIETVSDRCGFSYPHHFIKAFRQQFGLTPLQLRKRGLRPTA